MAEYIIGYDLNEENCQISYYSEDMQEPKTMETAADNYQIPLMAGKKGDTWYFGNDARRLHVINEGNVVSDLLRKALIQEKIQLGEETYEAVLVLAKFIEWSLERFENIRQIVFTVPEATIDISKLLKGIGQRIGVLKSCIYTQDYKESFGNYMVYQPKELWQYESVLFHYNQKEVCAYKMYKLRTGFEKRNNTFIMVEEVAREQIEELESVYPLLDEEQGKKADLRFKEFVQKVFGKRLISSAFLIGEIFEDNWYPLTLKILCSGRRIFRGNNLYSKGACYTAFGKSFPQKQNLVYLDETKMKEQISLKIRRQGLEEWYPIVPWGIGWYEADTQCEVLLTDSGAIEIQIESLRQNETRVEIISLEGLPRRKEYAVRLQIRVVFLDEGTCRFTFRDVGFGEFFPATDFCEEKVIHLGGSNG